MHQYAHTWVSRVAHHIDAATVVALVGDLGSGKTTFVQGVARALGVLESVTSPTFVIQKVYSTPRGRWKNMVHIDAYRFTSPTEAHILRLEETLRDASNLVFIEWPERVADVSYTETLVFKWVSENERAVTEEHPLQIGT